MFFQLLAIYWASVCYFINCFKVELEKLVLGYYVLRVCLIVVIVCGGVLNNFNVELYEMGIE